MSKNINTVIPDVYALMKNQTKHTPEIDTIVQRVGNEVKDALLEALTVRQKKGGLRMSGIGKCERAQWYSVHGYEAEEISGEVYLTFLTGHVMEAVLLGIVEASGHEVTGQQKRHDVEGVKGSQDCYIDGELVDVKTASAWSYDNKFKEDGIKDDAFGYIKQLSGYGKTEGREEGYFLAFNKNKSTLKLCKQELEQDIDKHIIQLQEKMALDTPPMRLENASTLKKGEETLCMNCAFCGHKETCFGALTKKTINGGKFTYYTVDKVAGSF